MLAAVLGGYLLLSTVGLLFPNTAAERFVAALRDSPAAAHLAGAVAFLVGAAVLVVHHRWDGALAAAVTLTGAWWILEGALMLAVPRLLLSRPDAAVHMRRMNLVAIPVALLLICGAVLSGAEVLP